MNIALICKEDGRVRCNPGIGDKKRSSGRSLSKYVGARL